MPRLNCSRISLNSRCSSSSCGSRRSIRMRVSRGADSSKIIEPRSTNGSLPTPPPADAAGAREGPAEAGPGAVRAGPTARAAPGRSRAPRPGAGQRGDGGRRRAVVRRGRAPGRGGRRRAPCPSRRPGRARRPAPGRRPAAGPLTGPEGQLDPLLVMVDRVRLEGDEPVGDPRRPGQSSAALVRLRARAAAPRRRGAARRPAAAGPPARDGDRDSPGSSTIRSSSSATSSSVAAGDRLPRR